MLLFLYGFVIFSKINCTLFPSYCLTRMKQLEEKEHKVFFFLNTGNKIIKIRKNYEDNIYKKLCCQALKREEYFHEKKKKIINYVI